ncbi:glutathione S-transferase [Shewanella surugensis]|uniref:Glutathione S-transferase n=1 Tax=Shewanella surugensis TaxID=212020 RepID=A0ABT0L7H6_9GAMM|nr:glutathione S-transferase [Shewanella surugensis]MCL1123620.1 glutathione S-transferase [Shewanella surugensis]
MSLPILYSFRRCPYAMRARLGILLSHQSVSLKEIILKHKPESMLNASPKGTVPVLILTNSHVIDESLDIMFWALNQSDPQQILPKDQQQIDITHTLIRQNDTTFKPWLDKYKYADRHPEHSATEYRQQAEQFIFQLETQLTISAQLLGESASLADYAIFPFIRQFAHVDVNWFNQAPYPNTRSWLNNHIESQYFTSAMKKYPLWLDSQQMFTFGDTRP